MFAPFWGGPERGSKEEYDVDLCFERANSNLAGGPAARTSGWTSGPTSDLGLVTQVSVPLFLVCDRKTSDLMAFSWG